MLTDTACRKANPGEKDRKIFDERGLYLLVRLSGAKLWRLKYRFAGKEKLLAIGPYPEVSISQARNARDKALHQLREGVDPSAEKQMRKAQAIADALDSFENTARAWHAVKVKSLSDRYAEAVLSRLEKNVFPSLGSKPHPEHYSAHGAGDDPAVWIGVQAGPRYGGDRRLKGTPISMV